MLLIMQGEYVHLLGADDVLLPNCIERCYIASYQDRLSAVYHGLAVVNRQLSPMNISLLDLNFAAAARAEAIVGLKSIPSGSWFIAREIASKIFPIPQGIPYEDIWMSGSN